MFKHVNKYRPFIKVGMQGMVAYRAIFFLQVIAQSLGAFVTYYLWRAIFLSSSDASLNGFSLSEMTLYVLLSFFTALLTSSGGNWSIGEEVRDGSISMRLLKPVSFSVTYLFQEIGEKVMMLVLVAIPFLIGLTLLQFVNSAVASLSFSHFLFYLISVSLAYLINFYFNICFGFTAFIFKNLWGSTMMKNAIIAFMSGALIPLSFFPYWIGTILQLLPFASLIYTPIMIGMGKYSGDKLFNVICLQVLWLGFFVILEKLIWHIVIKQLNIQGG